MHSLSSFLRGFFTHRIRDRKVFSSKNYRRSLRTVIFTGTSTYKHALILPRISPQTSSGIGIIRFQQGVGWLV
jgi:hypothetical protein